MCRLVPGVLSTRVGWDGSISTRMKCLATSIYIPFDYSTAPNKPSSASGASGASRASGDSSFAYGGDVGPHGHSHVGDSKSLRTSNAQIVTGSHPVPLTLSTCDPAPIVLNGETSHIPLSYLTPLHFIILEFALNPGPWNISWPTSLYAGSYRRFFIWPSRATIYLSLDSLQCLFLFVPPLLRFLPMVTRGFPTHQANSTFTKTRHINRHFQLPFCIIYVNEVMRVSVPAVE